MQHFSLLRISIILCAVSAVSICLGQDPKNTAANPDRNQAAAKSAEPKTKPVAETAAPVGGVVVFVDPATGRVRQPDASEIGKLNGTPKMSNLAVESAPTMISGPNGAIGMKLGGKFRVYSVASQATDGKVQTECVQGEAGVKARVPDASDSKPQAK